jgi:uncharacterized membrane protein
MYKLILHYLATVPIFFAIDIIWLGWLGRPLYKKYIGHLMASPPNWSAALMFYALYILGILIFAVWPALKLKDPQHALLYGALFGFFTYMTYELTNMAVIKGWSWSIVPIDILWGVILCSAVSVCSYYAGIWLSV